MITVTVSRSFYLGTTAFTVVGAFLVISSLEQSLCTSDALRVRRTNEYDHYDTDLNVRSLRPPRSPRMRTLDGRQPGSRSPVARPASPPTANEPVPGVLIGTTYQGAPNHFPFIPYRDTYLQRRMHNPNYNAIPDPVLETAKWLYRYGVSWPVYLARLVVVPYTWLFAMALFLSAGDP